MKEPVLLRDISLKEDGLIEVCYANGNSKLEAFNANPKGMEYKSFATAKSAIMVRLRKQFGKTVKISEELEAAINNLADMLCVSLSDKEEGEAMWAANQMRDIEEADARRERWLYQRK